MKRIHLQFAATVDAAQAPYPLYQFTLIGGLSISAFPLFSGFVSKSMIAAAGFDEHQWITGNLSRFRSKSYPHPLIQNSR